MNKKRLENKLSSTFMQLTQPIAELPSGAMFRYLGSRPDTFYMKLENGMVVHLATGNVYIQQAGAEVIVVPPGHSVTIQVEPTSGGCC